MFRRFYLLQKFPSQATYVEQENIFLEHFTVKETINFYASIALNFSLAKMERQALIEGVITDLGLKTCQDTKIGGREFQGISGGQKKRLSTAIALLTDSPILFLDEPTTGTDSVAAFDIIKTIKTSAEEGMSKDF